MQTLSSVDYAGFGAFLHSKPEETLDLSKCSLMEIIDKDAEFQSRKNPHAWKQFSCVKTQIKKIEEAFGTTIMPLHVNELFWTYFISFIDDRCSLASSSLETVCTRIKCTLKWASRYKCPISPTFDLVKIKVVSNKQVVLSTDEISHIYHFDVNSIKRRPQYIKSMEQVRDAFVLMCSLGQRYSDIVRIDKTCFDRNTFRIVQQKTGNTAVVDIDKFCVDKRMVYSILEKYDYEFPFGKDKDIGMFNKYLKQLLQYIGGEFCDDIKIEKRKNGKIVTEYVKKWKMISSHTARRIFVTLNVLRGYNLVDIRRATGHHSITAFERYYIDEA